MEIKLTKAQFTELYLDTTVTTKQLAEQLQVSEYTLFKTAKQLGLSRNKPRYTNKLIIED